jgi:hypothetical protein
MVGTATEKVWSVTECPGALLCACAPHRFRVGRSPAYRLQWNRDCHRRAVCCYRVVFRQQEVWQGEPCLVLYITCPAQHHQHIHQSAPNDKWKGTTSGKVRKMCVRKAHVPSQVQQQSLSPPGPGPVLPRWQRGCNRSRRRQFGLRHEWYICSETAVRLIESVHSKQSTQRSCYSLGAINAPTHNR